MWKQALIAFRAILFWTVLTGLLYPAAVTGLCQLFFPRQADGSLVTVNGHVVGSALIGQNFSQPKYFQPRPSAAGTNGYDPTASGGSNLGPTSKVLNDRLLASAAKFHAANPDFHGPIPADLLTASGSGLDPDLSPAAADAQVERIAQARGLPSYSVQALIDSLTQPPQWHFLGDPRVNVLQLNLALDRTYPQ